MQREIRLDFGEARRAAQLEMSREPETLLRDFLTYFPARSAEQIPREWLDLPLSALSVKFINLPKAAGHVVRVLSPVPEQVRASVDRNLREETSKPPVDFETFPSHLSDSEAVRISHYNEIKRIARYLSNHLSVLVVCPKILVEHIYDHIVQESGKDVVLESSQSGSGGNQGNGAHEHHEPSADIGTRIADIGRLLARSTPSQVLVLRHLDMLAGNSPDGSLTSDGRLLTEALYRSQEFTPTILGFIDPSHHLPQVLLDRFAVRVELSGLHRENIPHLVTAAEGNHFDRFEPETLFKNVTGFNVIQFRNAMRYLFANSTCKTALLTLMQVLRQFKYENSEHLMIPDETVAAIGGYTPIKAQVAESIELMTGIRLPAMAENKSRAVSEQPSDLASSSSSLPESVQERKKRRQLAPQGLLFHGPPGTGKELFARVVASMMNATLQMVSGSEMVGLGEHQARRSLHHLVARARRNAPSVIFFDEFERMVKGRSSLSGEGIQASNGSGAGNGGYAPPTITNQLLAEIDAIPMEQDVLVIGATTSPDDIDQRLLHPSRFQSIAFGLPEASERYEIAAIHIAAFDINQPHDQLLDLIASKTDGLSGDEIRAVVQQVARRTHLGERLSEELIQSETEAIKMWRKKRDASLVEQ